jgi:hypothetical protein
MNNRHFKEMVVEDFEVIEVGRRCLFEFTKTEQRNGC